ncbi:SRPBCC family protein [Streptomyces canus]|uniref:SRPBCC family protein n=1 Tax=Streptomyces canus TaxID=58343 RepID=UPI0003688526|nr:SRPBCC family protein [Streptomyces canus]
MELEVDIDHSAPVIVRASCEINAPIDQVWEIHSNVPAWPQWQKDIRVAEIDGELAAGSNITWGAWGYDGLFPAHIGLIEHQRRTVWSGANAGIYGIHAFTFTPRGHVTEVETAESWDTDPGSHAVATLQTFLQGWLDHLKATVENTSPSA